MRKALARDAKTLRDIHERAGYGFPFPDLAHMELVYVLEENGRIVGGVAAELSAEIFFVLDPEWQASPHQKIKAVQDAHAPIAKQLEIRGVKTANLWLDPKWPAFGRHLLRLGWSRSLWPHYFRNVRKFLTGEK